MFVSGPTDGAAKRSRRDTMPTCLKKDHTMNLRTMRYESIEVQYALRVLLDATVKGRFNGTGKFYDTILPAFYAATVADLASYGLSVYHIDEHAVPHNVDIGKVNIFVHQHSFPIVFTAEYSGAEHHNIQLHVIVHDPPDTVCLTLRGCISLCLNEYIEGRIITCNEVAIGSSNAQPVFTLNHTSDQKQLEIMRAVNYAHNNSFNDTGIYYIIYIYYVFSIFRRLRAKKGPAFFGRSVFLFAEKYF